MSSRTGIDTGGTFTDFVWVDAQGQFHIHKQLSTPDDPSLAILAGLQVLGVPETAVSGQPIPVIHGSTVATNALLERRGAKTALITTSGFADVLAIGRQNRPDLYALVPQKPAPLVPAPWRFTVSERISAAGQVLTPLNLTDLHPILRQIQAEGIESVAICLLFSFVYPAHEQRIRQAIREWLAERGDAAATAVHISLSSDILPEYREYERTSTTVINAYVAPLMTRYLSRLEARLGGRRLAVMQSNGGIINAALAGEQAARTALSGPAGGLVGARAVAAQAGFTDIITFDMGGTSTDVALCPGQLPTTTRGEIGGMPLRLPMMDIHTVGAGGGSLAYVDAGGALHVGPQSAGADPGPACYGRSPHAWSAPMPNLPALMSHLAAPITVTDANLVLGRLDADAFLGGTMRLDVTAARQALGHLAQAMSAAAGLAVSLETAAASVLQVANAHMERAIRHISVQRGYDPRRFTLVAFGGAGPLHACDLAVGLQIPRVLIPAWPGVLSALGMLVAAPTKDYSQTVMWQMGLEDSGQTGAALRAQMQPLRVRALAEMAVEGSAPAAVRLHEALDMRYKGQSHELSIAYEPQMTDMALRQAFHEAHQTRYGYCRVGAAVEVVTVRVTAVAHIPPLHFPTLPLADPAGSGVALLGEKLVWFDGTAVPTSLYDRAKLQPGHCFGGPAIVFQYDTTTVIPPGWETAVDAWGNLIICQGDEVT